MDKVVPLAMEKRGGAFMLGILFLCNPIVSTVDVLPDLVGALFILRALGGFRYLSAYFASAVRSFSFYAVLSFLKLPATALLFFLVNKYPTQTTLFPLFSFTFTILEFLLLFPAFFNLLHGMEQLEARRGPFPSRFFSYIPRLYKITVAFFLVRGILAFLPDLLFLTDDAASSSWTSLYPFAAFFSILPVLVITYLWYTAMKEYKNAFFTDTAVDECIMDGLSHAKKKMAIEKRARKISFGWLLVALSALFMVDLRLNAIDVLSDCFMPLCLLAAIFFLKDTPSLSRRAFIFGGCSFLFSVLADIGYALFFQSFSMRDLYHVPHVETAYLFVMLVFLVKLVFDTLFFLSIRRPLTDIALSSDDIYFEKSVIHRQADKQKAAHHRVISVFTFSFFAVLLMEAITIVSNYFPVRYEADANLIASGEVVLPALDFIYPLFFILALVRFLYMLFARARFTDNARAASDEEENTYIM